MLGLVDSWLLWGIDPAIAVLRDPRMMLVLMRWTDETRSNRDKQQQQQRALRSTLWIVIWCEKIILKYEPTYQVQMITNLLILHVQCRKKVVGSSCSISASFLSPLIVYRLEKIKPLPQWQWRWPSSSKYSSRSLHMLSDCIVFHRNLISHFSSKASPHFLLLKLRSTCIFVFICPPRLRMWRNYVA